MQGYLLNLHGSLPSAILDIHVVSFAIIWSITNLNEVVKSHPPDKHVDNLILTVSFVTEKLVLGGIFQPSGMQIFQKDFSSLISFPNPTDRIARFILFYYIPFSISLYFIMFLLYLFHFIDIIWMYFIFFLSILFFISMVVLGFNMEDDCCMAVESSEVFIIWDCASEFLKGNTRIG